MSEIYVLVSGTKESQDRWRNDLSTHFFPIWKNNKKKLDKNGLTYHRRLIVAPIQLYKVCTEKENIDDVLNILGIGDNYVLERYKKLKVMTATIRKFLGLTKIPNAKRPNILMQPEQVQKAVAVIPIGIKKDQIHNGQEDI